MRIVPYPPLQHRLFVSAESRENAYEGASSYCANGRFRLSLHEVLRVLIRTLGPGVLPGSVDVDSVVQDLSEYRSAVEQRYGSLTVQAVYRREQEGHRQRMSGALCKSQNGRRFFVKSLEDADEAGKEIAALEAVDGGTGRFRTPRLIEHFPVGGNVVLLMEAMPPVVSCASDFAEARGVSEEIAGVLESKLARPTGTPGHWIPIHGDFAPWNLRSHPSQELPWLIDWGEVGWGPPGADLVYFALQDGSVDRLEINAEQREFWLRTIQTRSSSKRNRRMLLALG